MNERIVGKKAEPTVEELEFIYEHLAKLSDQEVLEEMQDTEFPRRSLGFIKRRRREFNTAKRVLQLQLEREVNPIVLKCREEHLTKLADIVTCLLANDLGSANLGWTTQRVTGQVKYILTRRNEVGNYYELTNEQLSTQLKENIILAEHEYERWFFHDCFLPHLKSELPDELKTKGFFDVVKEQPYELIKTLRVLEARGIFKGTCPVCKDW